MYSKQRADEPESAVAAGNDEIWQPPTELCSWFTEGFDTKDLQEAKALLAELA